MLIFESHSEMMLWDGGQPVLQPQSVCFRRVGKPKASMFVWNVENLLFLQGSVCVLLHIFKKIKSRIKPFVAPLMTFCGYVAL